MIKYQVHRKRGRIVWLEVEGNDTWGWLSEEIRNKQGWWDRSAIRVPIEGLRDAVARVTIQHEVG